MSIEAFDLSTFEQSQVASMALHSLRAEIHGHVEGLGDLSFRLLEAQIARSAQATARQIVEACDPSELAQVHEALSEALNEANSLPAQQPMSMQSLAELLAGIRLWAAIGAELRKQSWA